ncbi:hypothetical protein P280DRAFT_552735 [Massarina eburnea CBS 473.64]|uniref:Protein kinase domain-containing protein n=1 Tax=Massarina eburnea CBS 473.64 TaxID=1395130 RepID=A0A6A6RNJ4_9PLEO|nr:hypothetical protein P280DRAFT_552735 [Massarina eburnea CBS 473.64]
MLSSLPPTALTHYKPLHEAGHGSQGTVSFCIPHTNPTLSNLIAIKTNNNQDPLTMHTTPEQRIHALRTIKAAQSSSSSPSTSLNIVQVLDISHMADAVCPWYTMQAIQGCTLTRLMQRWDGEFSIHVVAHVYLELFSAVRFLDAAGLVFDDFTRDNVMVEYVCGTELPRVKLVDIDDVHGYAREAKWVGWGLPQLVVFVKVLIGWLESGGLEAELCRVVTLEEKGRVEEFLGLAASFHGVVNSMCRDLGMEGMEARFNPALARVRDACPESVVRVANVIVQDEARSLLERLQAAL